MRKIPTLFERDPDDRKHVLRTVTAGCEWVLAGEGTATRKWDGTCVLVMQDSNEYHVFTRREVKAGKVPPVGFVQVEHDPVTGKTVGWEPVEQSNFAKYVEEAWQGDEEPGTYELIGPKVNGNPEGWPGHALIRHGTFVVNPTPLTFDALRDAFLAEPYEGVVWHHPDGRMCKLKRRDFA